MTDNITTNEDGFIEGSLKTGDAVVIPDLNDLERYILIEVTNEDTIVLTSSGLTGGEAIDTLIALVLSING